MEARERITKAIRKRKVLPLAAASGVHFSRLYAFLLGGGLDPVTAGRLRAAMPEVAAKHWLALQAPLPSTPGKQASQAEQ
jgi:hypothetical protein